jgi:hypothetical protein
MLLFAKNKGFFRLQNPIPNASTGKSWVFEFSPPLIIAVGWNTYDNNLNNTMVVFAKIMCLFAWKPRNQCLGREKVGLFPPSELEDAGLGNGATPILTWSLPHPGVLQQQQQGW